MEEYRGFKIEKELKLELDINDEPQRVIKYVARNKYSNYFEKTFRIFSILAIIGFSGLFFISLPLSTINELYSNISIVLFLFCLALGLIQFIMYLILKPAKLQHKNIDKLKLLIDYEKDYVWSIKQ